MKTKIALIAGTRPEAIKLAPVYRALAASGTLEPVLVSTGQHREMLGQAFAAFGLRPDHDLGLMRPNQDLRHLTARVIESVGGLLATLEPAAVLVQGDTTTVLGSALAAFYQHIPVGHVEAGLRTYKTQPWPEEMIRRLVGPLSHWCFAPTEWSRRNLLAERIEPERVHVTGNTIVDALHWMRDRSAGACDINTLCRRCSIPVEFKRRHLAVDGPQAPWILVTGHRRESFGDGIDNLCTALLQLCELHPELGVLYPVHLNPRVQLPVRDRLGNHPRIILVPPLGYEDMVCLLGGCKFIISDSGGIQEEAPSMGKPVLVTRDSTERPEGVAAGVCRLVGTDPTAIVAEASLLIDDTTEYERRASILNPYGDGQAAARICRILERELCANGVTESADASADEAPASPGTLAEGSLPTPHPVGCSS